MALAVHLTFAMDRIRLGETITMEASELKALQQTKEYSSALEMAKELEKRSAFQFRKLRSDISPFICGAPTANTKRNSNRKT